MGMSSRPHSVGAGGIGGPDSVTVDEFTASVFDKDIPPSDFSIFTHSLKEKFDEIFANVKQNLPVGV